LVGISYGFLYVYPGSERVFEISINPEEKLGPSIGIVTDIPFNSKRNFTVKIEAVFDRY